MPALQALEVEWAVGLLVEAEAAAAAELNLKESWCRRRMLL